MYADRLFTTTGSTKNTALQLGPKHNPQPLHCNDGGVCRDLSVLTFRLWRDQRCQYGATARSASGRRCEPRQIVVHCELFAAAPTRIPVTDGAESLVFGFSLAVNAWVFFRISGGLFNPAVGVQSAALIPKLTQRDRSLWA